MSLPTSTSTLTRHDRSAQVINQQTEMTSGLRQTQAMRAARFRPTIWSCQPVFIVTSSHNLKCEMSMPRRPTAWTPQRPFAPGPHTRTHSASPCRIAGMCAARFRPTSRSCQSGFIDMSSHNLKCEMSMPQRPTVWAPQRPFAQGHTHTHSASPCSVAVMRVARFRPTI